MEKHNGWTNYATWRVNLELVGDIDPSDMGWEALDQADLASAIKEYVTEVIDDAPDGVTKDYAFAFLSDVNWYEIAKAKIDAYATETVQ